jgi:hypothetical protein
MRRTGTTPSPPTTGSVVMAGAGNTNFICMV